MRALPILLLASALLIPQARAEEQMLALRLAGGESAVYALSEITRIGFEGEETLVVVTAGGSDAYATESIKRIEFLFEFSSVEDPREAAGLIQAIRLFQSRPNPVTTGTQISFELPQAGKVELSVYSAEGRLVRALLAEEREAGRHAIAWDGADEAGRKVPGGAYFYRLRAPGCDESRRMILLP
ncbi:MAG: T9SS type A sorting domain-containing protein [Candidatus Eisenbacteria bacterium]|uniref:T9SS type A sorting domain-containing protein n=1 Tax=Eiseniibacteriota bacterium TaxID=2212470 RepID=A0A937XAT3_UNCEI|nr:T9SS type A sorting domain-containing protein [Candidatus Eisenbacteria bacterium]